MNPDPKRFKQTNPHDQHVVVLMGLEGWVSNLQDGTTSNIEKVASHLAEAIADLKKLQPYLKGVDWGIDLDSFLRNNAHNFTTVTELARKAQQRGLVKRQIDFVPLIERWMELNPNSFYAEIWLHGNGRLKARCCGKNIGLFRVKGKS